MATDDTTPDTPQEEDVVEEDVGPEQPTASEELEAYQEVADVDADTFDGVTDSVPGAVTELTPELTKKQLAAQGPAPLPTDGAGFAMLADTDNVADLGATPGTRVYVVSAGPQELVEGSDIFNPRTQLVEDAEIVVRTRDAKSQLLSVTVDDLEPVAVGSTKG